MSSPDEVQLRRLEAKVERLIVEKDRLLKLVKEVLDRLRAAGA